MATLMEERDRLIESIRATAKAAELAARDLTDEELADIEAKDGQIKGMNERIQRASKASQIVNGLGQIEDPDVKGKDSAWGTEAPALTIGEHFVKGLEDGVLGQFKSHRGGLRADVPEFKGGLLTKAPGDPNLTTTTGTGWLQPQIDRTPVRPFLERPTIASWLGAGQIDSTSLQYFKKRAFDPTVGGNFTFVAEGAKKPGLTFPQYDPVTETLRKIAGWTKVSDEMAEDLPFLVSEINNDLLYQLAMMEEGQLLRGDGVGMNLRGILNRSGVQAETSGGVADDLKALHRAITKVTTATGLRADGMILHPLDYEMLRLTTDANGQYFAGGPFMGGQYGNGTYNENPPIWGYSPITTTAVPRGTAIVGAGRLAATVYRKGGIRVEASNVDGEDFTHNRFTILAEERLMLAVRQPSAFVNVSLSSKPAPTV